MLDMFFLTLAGYLLGAIPFSLLMGKLYAKKDIRLVGDGNPGGANAIKAGGLKAGLPAVILDIGKGYLPVFLAQRTGLENWALVPVCLAPILGHAFSPYLRFRGGKGLGATAGAWIGLIGLWIFPIYGILAVPAALLQSEDAWSANAGMLALLGFSIFFGQQWMVAFALLNTLLIIWTHHRDLTRPPALRSWVTHIFAGRQA